MTTMHPTGLQDLFFCAGQGFPASFGLDLGPFWKGYVLDITGPAWNYILVRRLYASYQENKWVRFFTPGRTLTLFIAVSYGIEAAQYLEFYDSTYDPWDLLCYLSLLVPLFTLDSLQQRAMATY